MERYNSYKDSGVKWLGEIPSRWKLLPGLAVLKENKERNYDLSENTVLSLSYGRIIVKKDVDEGLAPAEYNSYQIVHPGYIIVSISGDQGDRSLIFFSKKFVNSHNKLYLCSVFV